MVHPWRRLRALAHMTLLWHDEGPDGVTNFVDQTVSIRRGMDQARRRSACMHEVLHAERGPSPAGLADREELRVWKETARELLPCVRAVGEALAWAQGDVAAAADELWVSPTVLRVWIRYLHPSERAWLRRRLEMDE